MSRVKLPRDKAELLRILESKTQGYAVDRRCALNRNTQVG